MKWAVMSLFVHIIELYDLFEFGVNIPNQTTAFLGLSKCLQHRFYALHALGWGHTGGIMSFTVCQNLRDQGRDKGEKGKKCPPVWIIWEGQAAVVPQEPFSRKLRQVSTHKPLSSLGGNVIISVYIWKESWIQKSSLCTLCFNGFHQPGWATGRSMHCIGKASV